MKSQEDVMYTQGVQHNVSEAESAEKPVNPDEIMNIGFWSGAESSLPLCKPTPILIYLLRAHS